MKRYHIVLILLLGLILTTGIGFGFLAYFGSEKRQNGEAYNGDTIVIEKNKEDEFALQISALIREFDGEKIPDEALTNPWYSRRLIVQGTGDTLDLTLYGAKTVVCGPDNLYVMQFTTEEATQIAYDNLQGLQTVAYCETDRYAEGSESGQDSEPMSWGVKETGAAAYAKHVQSLTKDCITVAVVDSGVYRHAFLKDRIADGGMDFVDNDMNPDDELWHGTHVAGTIVDCTPGLNVKILPVRVLGTDGRGSWLRISLGIRYAANYGVQIMNLSLGGKGISQTVDNAVLYAINRGCTVVAAAGNDDSDIADYSIAHLDRCIVVAAVDEDLKRADFQEWGSNWGQSIDIAAPGVNIVSCVPNRVGGFTIGGKKESAGGTSMATPHVSALAAMIKLKNPSLTPSGIEKEIVNRCIDLGEAGWDPYYGWGIPDLSKGLDNITADAMETNEKENNVEAIEFLNSSTEENIQADPMTVYEDILAEYKMLADNNFDRSLWEQAKYANEGVCNFGSMGSYSVYYKIVDLAEDGNPELLISINEDGAPKNIVDIFGIQDGVPVGLVESNESVGYRSRFYVCADNRIKNVESGGALNTEVNYYKLAADNAYLELEDQYIYDGWDGDRYTHTDNNGNSVGITGEEYAYISSEADVEKENDWQLLSGQDTDNKEDVEINTDNSWNNSGTSAYQGIFMRGDTFISLPLYTSYEPEGAIGVVYCVTKPEWDADGYIISEIIETVGEIYTIDSENKYEIRNGDIIYNLSYYEGKVILEGDSLYDGTYIQVSNSGANMDPSDIWLNLEPQNINGSEESQSAESENFDSDSKEERRTDINDVSENKSDTIHGTYTYYIEIAPPSWDTLSGKVCWEAEFLNSGMCKIDFCYGDYKYANDPSSYYESRYGYEVPYTIERDEGVIYLDNSYDLNVEESIAGEFKKCPLSGVEIIKD